LQSPLVGIIHILYLVTPASFLIILFLFVMHLVFTSTKTITHSNLNFLIVTLRSSFLILLIPASTMPTNSHSTKQIVYLHSQFLLIFPLTTSSTFTIVQSRLTTYAPPATNQHYFFLIIDKLMPVNPIPSKD
jgi:hypothetical protein